LISHKEHLELAFQQPLTYKNKLKNKKINGNIKNSKRIRNFTRGQRD
jgi:hypothetical protein